MSSSQHSKILSIGKNFNENQQRPDKDAIGGKELTYFNSDP